MTKEMTPYDISLNELEEKEANLFDELIKLPKENRHRLIEAVRVYELLEGRSDLLVEKLHRA